MCSIIDVYFSVPDWKDMTECADVQCTTVFHFQYISLDIKLNYETAAAKKIHFYSEDLQLVKLLSFD